MNRSILLLLLLSLTLAPLKAQKQPGYVGSETCAACHSEIAQRQSTSYMARTWQTLPGTFFSPNYSKKKLEGPAPFIEYLLASHDRQLVYRVHMPGQEPIALPVEAAVGERRHGVSFLVRLDKLGDTLPGRAALIATRYFHRSQSEMLELNPGFPASKPSSYETALGWVLSRSFEIRCLSCHGSPQHQGTGETGVRCENCHGPGQPHIDAVLERKSDTAIQNPGRLSPARLNKFCSQCHSGFAEVVAPRPEDLLISNQVTALEQSECYIQSGQQLSCTSCHDPHRNAAHNDSKYLETCLSCHAPGRKRAAACPVNPRRDCVTCHMPVTKQPGVLPLVDHWIRVHPEQSGPGAARSRAGKTNVTPRRVFLKVLAVPQRAQAEQLRGRLVRGESFFELARQHSTDPSAALGGFLGETWLATFDPTLAKAAAGLAHGQASAVLEARGRFVLLQRMPRDFRWQASKLAEEATSLANRGLLDKAIEKYQQSLRINPHFLQALLALATAFGEKGEGGDAVALLEQALRFFPRAAYAHFNLGIAYGLVNRIDLQVRAYRRAVELDPDLLAAYVNLGLLLLSLEQIDEAARVFEQAIQLNPLSAAAHYHLGRILEKQGKAEAAQKEYELAGKIDLHYK